MMGFLGKLLIIIGIILVITGIFLVLGPKIPFIGKLPGDIIIEKQNVRIFFPVVTCLLVSLFITLVLNIVLRFFR